jgi:hypothetical protein
MTHTQRDILAILDAGCDAYTFPMLDNGYVYLAATRLTLFRSPLDWAMTIEVFGFSPRSYDPDIHIHSFGSTLAARKTVADYISRAAYEQYLANNPHNESRFIYPLDSEWIDGEIVSPSATCLLLRDQKLPVPTRAEFEALNIELQDPNNLMVFEVCRYLAAKYRNRVLATPDELRGNVPAELTQILQLDEWNHPDVADDSCRPSGSETFQQLANVLVTGDASMYRPAQKPNTDWRNWPVGGTL